MSLMAYKWFIQTLMMHKGDNCLQLIKDVSEVSLALLLQFPVCPAVAGISVSQREVGCGL